MCSEAVRKEVKIPDVFIKVKSRISINDDNKESYDKNNDDIQ